MRSGSGSFFLARTERSVRTTLLMLRSACFSRLSVVRTSGSRQKPSACSLRAFVRSRKRRSRAWNDPRSGEAFTRARLDLDSLLTVSEAIALAALERKESRGAHFREDYMAKDEALGRTTLVIRKGADGSMQVHRAPVMKLTAEQVKIIEENK